MNIDWIENYYQIEPTGSVYSLRSGKVLSQRLRPDGYLQVVLNIQGKSYTYLVHRLVALKYLQNVNSCKTVNHINFNRADNRVENLEWATHKENLQRKRVNIIPEGGEVKIKELYSSGNYTQQQIADIYGADQGYISQVINGKRR